MQLEFAQVLADEGDQSRVVGPGRELGEHHFFGSLGSTEKELHPKQASPTQVVRHLAGHRLGGLQLGCSHGGRLPAALVIAPLLEVANRRTKQGGSIPLTHRQQGDLQAEAQKLLDDHAAAAAPGPCLGRGPGQRHFVGAIHHALPLARGAHHRLDDHGPAQGGGGGGQACGAVGVGIAGGAQAQFRCRQVADPVAVHRDRCGAGGGDHRDALGLQLDQGINRQGLDLRNHQIGSVTPHNRLERLRIGHRDHLDRMGHGHGRGAGIAVHRDHPAPQSLGGDRHFLAQLAAAQQHQGARQAGGMGWGHGAALRKPIPILSGRVTWAPPPLPNLPATHAAPCGDRSLPPDALWGAASGRAPGLSHRRRCH